MCIRDSPFDADRIAVSGPDAAYALERTLFMQPMTLRNARHLIMVVSNRETGEVYYANDTEYLPKAIYDTDNGWIATGSFLWDGTDLDGNAVPNDTKVDVNYYANIAYGADELGALTNGRTDYSLSLIHICGLTMIYNGQEVDNLHVPSLFDKDPINWNTGRDQSAFLAHLAAIKRDPIFAEGSYTLTALPHDVLLAVYEKDGRRMAGLFSLRGESALVRFPAPNGVYQNCIDGSPVEIYEEQLAIHGEPIVLAF